MDCTYSAGIMGKLSIREWDKLIILNNSMLCISSIEHPGQTNKYNVSAKKAMKISLKNQLRDTFFKYYKSEEETMIVTSGQL